MRYKTGIPLLNCFFIGLAILLAILCANIRMDSELKVLGCFVCGMIFLANSNYTQIRVDSEKLEFVDIRFFVFETINDSFELNALKGIKFVPPVNNYRVFLFDLLIRMFIGRLFLTSPRTEEESAKISLTMIDNSTQEIEVKDVNPSAIRKIIALFHTGRELLKKTKL